MLFVPTRGGGMEIFMKIKMYQGLPEEAKKIREEVFVMEQGFREEYDEIDQIATHFVLFENEMPVGTCRVFPGEEEGFLFFGRLAIKKIFRGKGFGRILLERAIAYGKEKNYQGIYLHSQWQAKGFYEKAGFLPYGEKDEEEGCPHIWMKQVFPKGRKGVGK